jgi:hypothetical protein
MDNLIDAIRNAIASDANDEARALGAQACRTILVALETPAGAPMAASTASTAIAEPTSPLEAAVSALRGLPPDQLLDLAIARLKAALPPETKFEPVRRLNVPLVTLPAIGRRP